MSQSDTSRAADVLSRLTDLTQVGTLIWRPASPLPRPAADPTGVAQTEVVQTISPFRASESDYEAEFGDDQLHLSGWDSYDLLSAALRLREPQYVTMGAPRRPPPPPSNIELWVKEPARLHWARLADPQTLSALRPFLDDLWRAVVGGADDVASSGFMDRVLRTYPDT